MDEVKKFEEATADRVLHMSEETVRYVEKLHRETAHEGIHDKFMEGLDYLQTYGGGGEKDFKTVLHRDVPFNHDERNLIAHIYSRHDGRDHHFMTIGMIWDRHRKNWSFHT